MQSLGFVYAIWPALRWLYPDEEQRLLAIHRHLRLFNTHPYLAAAIIGGVLRHEERIANGEESATAVNQYKEALMSPLAAVGDSFFWLALRPFAGAAAAIGSLWIGLWSVPLFLGVFVIPHLMLRVMFFRQGYRRGGGVVPYLASLELPRLGQRLRQGVAVLGGAALVLAAYRLSMVVSAPVGLEAMSAPFTLGALALASIIWGASYILLKRGGPIGAAYLAIALGIVVGAILGPL